MDKWILNRSRALGTRVPTIRPRQANLGHQIRQFVADHGALAILVLKPGHEPERRERSRSRDASEDDGEGSSDQYYTGSENGPPSPPGSDLGTTTAGNVTEHGAMSHNIRANQAGRGAQAKGLHSRFIDAFPLVAEWICVCMHTCT